MLRQCSRRRDSSSGSSLQGDEAVQSRRLIDIARQGLAASGNAHRGDRRRLRKLLREDDGIVGGRRRTAAVGCRRRRRRRAIFERQRRTRWRSCCNATRVGIGERFQRGPSLLPSFTARVLGKVVVDLLLNSASYLRTTTPLVRSSCKWTTL